MNKWGIYNGYAEEFWRKDGEVESFDTFEEAEAEACKWRENKDDPRGGLDDHESTPKELEECHEL